MNRRDFIKNILFAGVAASLRVKPDVAITNQALDESLHRTRSIVIDSEGGGFNYAIDMLTYIKREVCKQKFYAIQPKEGIVWSRDLGYSFPEIETKLTVYNWDHKAGFVRA